MLSVNKIKALNEKIYSSKIDVHNDYGLIADETQRISGISKNLVETFEKIDDDFKAATKLEKTDIAFLFLATGLQCVRQYLFTNFKLKEDRPNDQDAAKNAKGKNTNKEHSDRHHRLYNPSLICCVSCQEKKSRKDHSAIYQLLYSWIMNMFIP